MGYAQRHEVEAAYNAGRRQVQPQHTPSLSLALYVVVGGVGCTITHVDLVCCVLCAVVVAWFCVYGEPLL
jgi:hypothetical protein